MIFSFPFDIITVSSACNARVIDSSYSRLLRDIAGMSMFIILGLNFVSQLEKWLWVLSSVTGTCAITLYMSSSSMGIANLFRQWRYRDSISRRGSVVVISRRPKKQLRSTSTEEPDTKKLISLCRSCYRRTLMPSLLLGIFSVAFSILTCGGKLFLGGCMTR